MDSYQWCRGGVPGAMAAGCTFPHRPYTASGFTNACYTSGDTTPRMSLIPQVMLPFPPSSPGYPPLLPQPCTPPDNTPLEGSASGRHQEGAASLLPWRPRDSVDSAPPPSIPSSQHRQRLPRCWPIALVIFLNPHTHLEAAPP